MISIDHIPFYRPNKALRIKGLQTTREIERDGSAFNIPKDGLCILVPLHTFA